MKLKNLLLLLFSSTSVLSFGQTMVPPIVSTSQTWDTTGSPYIISQNTLIESGVKITVDPGVKIRTNAPNLSLMVDGEFQAVGTQSAPVEIDSLEISFSNKSVDYSTSTGQGAYFNWCIFQGDEQSFNKNAIKVSRTAIKIENCSFSGHYSAVTLGNQSSDTLESFVDNCTFNGRSSNRYAIYSFGSTCKTVVTNSKFDGPYQLYFYGKLHFENNVVSGHTKFDHFAYYEGLIKCNTFKNSRVGVNLTFYSVSKVQDYKVINNTFDSLGDPGSMLEIRRQTGSSDLSFLHISQNNFLYTSGNQKLIVSGTNSNPSTSARINCENNYWGTTDSATIEGFINHYSDNINVFGKVDFNPVANVPITGCDTSSCTASYYLALDTTTPFQLFVIDNSKGITSNTSYSWSFGDGSTSSSRNPTHKYASFGKYELCLTITDKSAGCSSTFCDSLGLDSHGKLLKEDGFTINVLSEDHVGIPKVENRKSINLYPNPTTGVVHFLDYNIGADIEVHVTDGTRRSILSRSFRATSLDEDISMNLSDNAPGLYIVHVRSGSTIDTFKVWLKG